MRRAILPVTVVGSVTIGVIAGFVIANWMADRAELESRYDRYASNARICLEASAFIRSNMPDAARAYLEQNALANLRGVPMGRAYDGMSPDSQLLLVAAKRYDAAFRDIDFELDQLTRGDVPSDHPALSMVIRSVTRKAEL